MCFPLSAGGGLCVCVHAIGSSRPVNLSSSLPPMCRSASPTLLLWGGTEPVLEVEQAFAGAPGSLHAAWRGGRHALSECLLTCITGHRARCSSQMVRFHTMRLRRMCSRLDSVRLSGRRARTRETRVRAVRCERTHSDLAVIPQRRAGCPCAQESAVSKRRRVGRARLFGLGFEENAAASL